MVEIRKVQSLYFSPTGSTKKILEAVTRGIDLPHADAIDITLPKSRDSWSGEFEGDLLLVGVPVYGSTFPSLLLPSLMKLRGEGRLAVPIAVFGNCKIGACLPEVSAILKKGGFTIPAAGNFVSQHAFATEDYRLGWGRPDGKDLEKAESFGRSIAVKVAKDPGDITSTYGGQLFIQCYVSGSLEAPGYRNQPQWFNQEHWINTCHVKVSRTDLEQCKNCLACAESCPTGAISFESLEIDNLACVRCFKCTSVCPSNILHKEMVPTPGLGAWWKIQGERRGEPMVFL